MLVSPPGTAAPPSFGENGATAVRRPRGVLSPAAVPPVAGEDSGRSAALGSARPAEEAGHRKAHSRRGARRRHAAPSGRPGRVVRHPIRLVFQFPASITSVQAASLIRSDLTRSSRPSAPLRITMRQWCGRIAREKTPAAELLKGVCDVDLDALDVELPRGFGPRLIGGPGGPSCPVIGPWSFHPSEADEREQP